MRLTLLPLLACPGCGGSLELRTLREATAPAGGGTAAAPEIDLGVLSCSTCPRAYALVDGIPRLTLPGFAAGPSPLDLLGARATELPTELRQRLGAMMAAANEPEAEWARAEMKFWDGQAYADPSVPPVGLDRTYPRKKHLIDPLLRMRRPEVIIEVGCGRAETVTACLDLAAMGALYVGVDLALGGLRLARRRVPGEFVQASITHLPFREDVADWLLCFGTLHHLPGHERRARALVHLLKPGGLAAFHESADRPAVFGRVPAIRRLVGEESEHEGHIDAEALRDLLAAEGELVFFRPELSALRTWLNVAFYPFLTRSRLVLDLLDACDQVAIAKLGPLVPPFRAGSVMALVRRRGREPEAPVDAARQPER
ncbi:MAG: methyltransferase domain-containing protein [Myxococcales bacterium]|nr:methyltransferase domain-containing protein [Myxococcales bacterium]